MSQWTEEERCRELEKERRKAEAARIVAQLEGVPLRTWFFAWCRAVKEVAALPLPDVSPLLRTVLADFKAMGPRVVTLCEGEALPPGDFRELLEEAQALEAKARQACHAMPEGEPESPEALALRRLALASQGLPFQLRHYADTRPEVTP